MKTLGFARRAIVLMRPRGLPEHLADFAVLNLDEGARRRIAVKPAKLGGREPCGSRSAVPSS